MRPLSNYLHKAMVPFHGIPFLAYSFLAIPNQSEVVIIVDYLSDQIVNYFGSCYKGRRIEYFRQTDPRGTGDALFQFADAYRPKSPIIVWQADQMIFSNEFKILSETESNAAIFCDTHHGLYDVGFWKIKPSTFTRMKEYFDGTEYRALPILEMERLNRITIRREKVEISFNTWEEVDLQCKQSKQGFLTESH